MDFLETVPRARLGGAGALKNRNFADCFSAMNLKKGRVPQCSMRPVTTLMSRRSVSPRISTRFRSEWQASTTCNKSEEAMLIQWPGASNVCYRPQAINSPEQIDPLINQPGPKQEIRIAGYSLADEGFRSYADATWQAKPEPDQITLSSPVQERCY